VSTLAVGLSYRSAPVAVLERAVLVGDAVADLLGALRASASVEEALVLSTCNRVEVYAEVSKFHGGVSEVSELLSRASGVPLEALSPHLYVHYEDSAVAHLFTVTAGLDSMVVGESQILGQVRTAYRLAREQGTVGRSLGALVQQALRVGKRVHAETGIDRAGASIVSAALTETERTLGSLVGLRALVIGAGSMGALAAGLLRRAGVGRLVILNRTAGRATGLAAAYDGRGAGLADLDAEVAVADLVLSSTGATGTVLTAAAVEAAMQGRDRRPLAVVDLALPRDVEPAVADISGVTLVDLATLGAALREVAAGRDIDAARRIVAEEVASFLAQLRVAHVGPTVVALRAKAADVVAAELARLDGRLPALTPRERQEVAATVRRVVDKLLHAPTVRVKELADGPGGAGYPQALRELFDLDPAAPVAVTRAGVGFEDEADPAAGRPEAAAS